ncbi:hypothetical protein GCM10011386_24120 [Parapedobacter defluvii]|uniref:Patatin-like phospholipase n=1 Tax=Parapedobacter defluvii TaxID=2045106 RepID=A0ABQ1M475_9SPHI|nr:hypothetical protein [Parapedobacter defluvii]GGC31260.1 hypothetical protein GCM10011386_24120 [Parapedobacter defluvii]
MKKKTLYGFLLRLYNTIKLNLFYVLLSLLVPVILWKVQVGRDIVVSLAESSQHSYLNTPLLIASFSLLALSNWAIPVLAIDIWRALTRRRVNSQSLYSGLISLYNGDSVEGKRQFPIRYFASLPWVIFLYVTVTSFFPGKTFVGIGVLVLLVAGIFLLDWQYRRKRVPRVFQQLWDNAADGNTAAARKKALRYVAFMTLFFLLFLALIGGIGYGLRSSRTGVILLIVSAHFVSILANYAYMKFAENVDIKNREVSYFVSKYIHICSLSCTLLLAIFLQFCNGSKWPVEIGFFSPIFILITAISLFLFLTDVLITAQLNITWVYNGLSSGQPVWAWYNPMIRLFALGFLFLFFFNSVNSHRIRKQIAPPDRVFTADMRPSLTAYFDRWVQDRVTGDRDTLNVYLISGQGGGSRAAVWFFMAMNYLDSLKSTPSSRFSEHVFSISTVSGSTSGAAMYLADRYLNVSPQPMSVVPRMKTLYARNYLSSSFWGALIGDGFEGIKYEAVGRLSDRRAFPKDRNYYFQQEEIQGYTEATPSLHRKEIDGFFKTDYLKPYVLTADTGQSRSATDPITFHTALPLFFINSAIVETGQRGVFAPVDLASFSLGTDLYASFKRYNPHYNIPLIACVNQSQAFPIINAYNYLDGAGRLIDGGIYENSGTATTLEIYETLRRHLAAKPDAPYRVRFVCINLVNTNMDAVRDDVRFRPASVLNTLTAAFQSPFGGHEQFSYRNILRRVIAPDTAYSFPLDKPVPLTRMLQSAAIDTMYVSLRAMK